ncbi:hypothetical protein FMUND_6442 [Fusarium mundagurra]|uniref:Uncharacterized protein n=1 Tax=Fusarium mundagurra TaxID=1567541 RepID=A0A8H6DFW5_9HYPO|nr:hypothetical protein FMUND_6442 [Fusarium mundagurra]
MFVFPFSLPAPAPNLTVPHLDSSRSPLTINPAAVRSPPVMSGVMDDPVLNPSSGGETNRSGQHRTRAAGDSVDEDAQIVERILPILDFGYRVAVFLARRTKSHKVFKAKLQLAAI